MTNDPDDKNCCCSADGYVIYELQVVVDDETDDETDEGATDDGNHGDI